MSKAVVLCILDGWGYRDDGPDNAIANANTPNWNAILKKCPHTLLEASELNVGLPKGQMGNSEVGHMTIGAGRVIFQDLPRIDEAIENHTLETMPTLINFIASLKKSGGTCHLLGLLSSGGIHSHERHIKAIATIIAKHGVPVAVHAFLDGRDTPPQRAGADLSSFFTFMKDYPGINLATIGGRYYGMDRDNRWERVKKAYQAIVEGIPYTEDAVAYLHQSYENGVTDEFVLPVALESFRGMKDGDGLFMANFRSDRVRQILTALLDPFFTGFERSHVPSFVAALGVTEYSETLNLRMETLFPSSSPHHVLGEIISDAGLKQLRIAETEKYAHVTFFFNGGREEVFSGEDRILIPSPKVATYDLKPEMSAFELTDSLVQAIENKKYSLIVVNYANMDMLGHTGDFEATCKAAQVVDACLGRISEAVTKTEACLIITADHGNAEVMYDEKLHSPHTAHTLNPVPFVILGGPKTDLHPGKLSDITPTILEILGLIQPIDMTGKSLLETVYA